MFPACAGMNRNRVHNVGSLLHVPRVCGDEPSYEQYRKTMEDMFPACAGMNRVAGGSGAAVRYVPRVCGDEPYLNGGKALSIECSPRVRG